MVVQQPERAHQPFGGIVDAGLIGARLRLSGAMQEQDGQRVRLDRGAGVKAPLQHQRILGRVGGAKGLAVFACQMQRTGH